MKSLFTFLIALSVATTLFAQTNIPENPRDKNFAKELSYRRYHENDMMQKRLLERKKEYLHKHKKNSSKSNYKGKANEQDSLALVAIYNATDGNNWNDNTNWLTGNVVDWYGITLDSNGRVAEIHLYGTWGDRFNMVGNIPTEIGNLTSLTVLHLSYNQLTDSIPSEIGNLTSLTILDLAHNYLSGSILAEIGNLTNLGILDLASNYLSGSIPAEIGNLTSLTKLNLYGNELTGSIPDEIGNLTNLDILDLFANYLSGNIPAQIGNLTSLEYLYLQDNQLNGSIPAQIGNLTNLKYLHLNDNQLNGSIPAETGNLTNLFDLELYRNQLSGNIPDEIGNLINLKILDLSSNYLSGNIPATMGNLTNLRWLFIENNQLSGSIPAEMGNLTNLDHLILNRNQLSGSIPTEIGKLTSLGGLVLSNNQLSGSIPIEIGNLMYLSSLQLDSNQLSSNIPAEIGNLMYLSNLQLNDNQLSGCIPVEFGNLANLRKLSLNNNQLAGNIPSEMGNLRSLTRLILDKNQLSGIIPAEMGNLKKLERFELNHNQLTGSIPTEIGNLKNLKQLELNHNQLSGSIPAEIGSLTNLEYLYLANNQLSGSIPVEIGNLTSIELLHLNDNQFYGLPDLSTITNMYRLEIFNNKFTFEDIEPNVNVAIFFNYSPQAKVGSVEHYTPNSGDNLILEVTVGGTANTYQWYKNDTTILDATDSIYTITNYNSTNDAGVYMCKINNTIAAELTLESRNIYVGIDVTTFDISASVNPESWGTFSGDGAHNDGATAELTATSNTGYDFENWTEDGKIVSVNSIYSFIVDSSRTLVANFDNTFDIIASVNPTEYGTVNGAGLYEYGATAELTATPETGYRFVNWTEDGSEVSFDLTYSFTVTEDRTLVANFEDPTSISELESNVSFIVYPNPAKDIVNIQLNNIEFNNNLNVQLNLFDSLGRKLEVSTDLINSSIIQIDVSDKPAGIYYLQIIIDNKLFKAVKFIVSK